MKRRWFPSRSSFYFPNGCKHWKSNMVECNRRFGKLRGHFNCSVLFYYFNKTNNRVWFQNIYFNYITSLRFWLNFVKEYKKNDRNCGRGRTCHKFFIGSACSTWFLNKFVSRQVQHINVRLPILSCTIISFISYCFFLQFVEEGHRRSSVSMFAWTADVYVEGDNI